MFAFHAENHVGPTDVAIGDFDAGTIFGSGGTSVVTRMILKERFRRWTAPLVAGADEKEFGFQDMLSTGS